jgi:GNAT superfamily N-acetyltransferase
VARRVLIGSIVTISSPRIVDVDLENFHRIPGECRATLYWEMDHDDPEVNPGFQKEEWFSSTLLEWGSCGKLLVSDADAARLPGSEPEGSGDVAALELAVIDHPSSSAGARQPAGDDGAGFAEYAPATLFPRLQRFPTGAAATAVDAVYLAYCYVIEERRGQGLGSALVREVARAAVDRGYRAVEALGDRAWDGGWVIPVSFLAANGFTVVRDDERFPLLRLDLRSRDEAPLEGSRAAVADVAASEVL